MAQLLGGFVLVAAAALAVLLGGEWLERHFPGPFRWSRSVRGFLTMAGGGLTATLAMVGLFVWLGATDVQGDSVVYYGVAVVFGLFAARIGWVILDAVRRTRRERRSWSSPWVRR